MPRAILGSQTTTAALLQEGTFSAHQLLTALHTGTDPTGSGTFRHDQATFERQNPATKTLRVNGIL